MSIKKKKRWGKVGPLAEWDGKEVVTVRVFCVEQSRSVVDPHSSHEKRNLNWGLYFFLLM